MKTDTLTRFGAHPEDWQRLDALGIGTDLLPVVSNPAAPISPNSAMKQLGKTPSQYAKDRTVVGIPRWTEHQASDAEIRRWSKEPDYGICVQTRSMRALDIDVEDRAVSDAIVQAVRKFLGFRLPRRWRKDSGKCLLRFRLEGHFPKRVMHVEGGIIEFLGNGQQFVAYGTHPKGERYEWERDGVEAGYTFTPDQFEALWQHLTDMFAIETPRQARSTERRRGADREMPDPVADWLEANGLVLDTDPRGSLLIECPWAGEHSSGEAGDTSTVWFPAGTNGHSTGHFKCLHAHCDHRTRQDYLVAVGYEEDVANDFEDLGPDPDAGNPASEEGAAGAETPATFALVPAFVFANQPSGTWLIKGMIPKADLGVIYGASGAGKSFIVLDLAIAIARGIPWRNLRVRKGRVVYIVAEGAGGFRKRLRAYAQQHAIDLKDIDLLVLDAAPNLLDVKQMKQLCSAIEGVGDVALIVVDTFAQTTPGANENAGEDMGKAISHLRIVGRKAGAVVLLVHHSGKDAAKGARGWSGIRAAADFELEVTRDGENRALNTTKQKDADDTATWPFRLERITIGIDDDGDDIDSAVVVESDVQVEAGVSGGKRKAVAEKRLGPWETALLDTFAELAVGGDVLKTELIIRAADSRPEAGSLRDRRKNARRALSGLSRGDKAAFISSKEDDYVTLVQ